MQNLPRETEDSLSLPPVNSPSDQNSSPLAQSDSSSYEKIKTSLVEQQQKKAKKKTKKKNPVNSDSLLTQITKKILSIEDCVNLQDVEQLLQNESYWRNLPKPLLSLLNLSKKFPKILENSYFYPFFIDNLCSENQKTVNLLVEMLSEKINNPQVIYSYLIAVVKKYPKNNDKVLNEYFLNALAIPVQLLWENKKISIMVDILILLNKDKLITFPTKSLLCLGLIRILVDKKKFDPRKLYDVKVIEKLITNIENYYRELVLLQNIEKSLRKKELSIKLEDDFHNFINLGYVLFKMETEPSIVSFYLDEDVAKSLYEGQYGKIEIIQLKNPMRIAAFLKEISMKNLFLLRTKLAKEFQFLKEFSNERVKSKNSQEGTEALAICLQIFYEDLGDDSAGLDLARIVAMSLRNTTKEEKYILTIAPVTAFEILEVLRKKNYEVAECYILQEEIAEICAPLQYAKILKEKLSKFCADPYPPFNRFQMAGKLINQLNNLHNSNNQAASLMLAELATEKLHADERTSMGYGIKWADARHILENLIKNEYEMERCKELLKAIEKLENSDLSLSDTESCASEEENTEEQDPLEQSSEEEISETLSTFTI